MKRLVRLPHLFTILILLQALPAGAAEVSSIFIQTRLDYNAILISGIDVLFIYDEALIEEVPATKSQWYSGKEAFLARAGDRVDLRSVFIPQGFDSEMMSLPDRRDEAARVFVFAEHDVADRAPIDITDMEDVLVEINQFGILVSSRN